MRKARTYLEKWSALSPIEARLCARKPWRTPLGTKEIAERSGLTMQKVRWISSQSWEKLIGDYSKFLSGCGLTPSNEHRQVEYLKRTQRNVRGAMAHLDRLSPREKRRLLKLMD